MKIIRLSSVGPENSSLGEVILAGNAEAGMRTGTDRLGRGAWRIVTKNTKIMTKEMMIDVRLILASFAC